MDFKDSMYDECVVDMTPFGIEECYGDVSNAVAEVCVSAHAAETAGNFNMALRRKELRRLRAALWELRVTLERQSKDSGHCTLTVRHKLEALRSASLDVCHPQMRAANAPNATAIPKLPSRASRLSRRRASGRLRGLDRGLDRRTTARSRPRSRSTAADSPPRKAARGSRREGSRP